MANMTWDNTLAAYTHSYVNQRVDDCSLMHSNGPYGKNLAKGTSTFTGTYAISLWVAEKQNCNYNTNTCASGCDFGDASDGEQWQRHVTATVGAQRDRRGQFEAATGYFVVKLLEVVRGNRVGGATTGAGRGEGAARGELSPLKAGRNLSLSPT
ncbi:pathogenesis-related leaf protein 4-like [Eucalyptus grandis]|uniref:pathogenesis-related leaf protein 4-like n=1 Tax=Eucalyptus grandis TaxID=71139 RepID=UPI00192E7BFA|nr:pathogenesis-related leaf protein 4-like [Eucalyptus grandis]